MQVTPAESKKQRANKGRTKDDYGFGINKTRDDSLAKNYY